MKTIYEQLLELKNKLLLTTDITPYLTDNNDDPISDHETYIALREFFEEQAKSKIYDPLDIDIDELEGIEQDEKNDMAGDFSISALMLLENKTKGEDK